MREPAAHTPRPPAPCPTVQAEHRPMLVGYLYRRTRDRDLAEDLAQETLMRAVRGPSSYRDQGGGPGPEAVQAAQRVRAAYEHMPV